MKYRFTNGLPMLNIIILLLLVADLSQSYVDVLSGNHKDQNSNTLLDHNIVNFSTIKNRIDISKHSNNRMLVANVGSIENSTTSLRGGTSSSSTTIVTAAPTPTIHPSTTTTTTATKDGLPDRDFCEKKYGRRSFINGVGRSPPLLFSFPGSGNTWVRLLIEYSTGILTGSLYDDLKLVGVLPGEMQCSAHESAIKAHPTYHNIKDLRKGEIITGTKHKCKKGDVESFQRVAVILRDPYDAIWSEYEREFSESHTGGILRKKFSSKDFEKKAIELAKGVRKMYTEDLVRKIIDQALTYIA